MRRRYLCRKSELGWLAVGSTRSIRSLPINQRRPVGTSQAVGSEHISNRVDQNSVVDEIDRESPLKRC